MKNAIISAAISASIFAASAMAQPPILVDPQTGKYLGNLSSNQFDPNSVSNPYGRYGSKFSPDSINNQFGRYGSPYSNSSVNNPYATSPPKIVAPPTFGPPPTRGFRW